MFAFVVAAALSLALTPLCRFLAFRWGALDQPAPRKVHRRPMPLLGGVAVFLAFAASTALFLRPVVPLQVPLLLAGAAAFGLIGLIDDLYDVGALKLGIEAVVVTAIVLVGNFKVHLPWPGAGEILAILWILGVANAVNCLDSTDGAAPGIAVIGGLSLAVLALAVNRPGVAVAAVALSGAALGFLRYNFPPARIFLGDAGSLMIGFVLAGLGAAVAAPRISHEWMAPVLIVGVPVFDFLLVHLRRYKAGIRDPFRLMTSTGRDHLTHRLLDAGLSPRQVAGHVYRLSALAGVSAIVLVFWGPLAATVPVALALMQPAALLASSAPAVNPSVPAAAAKSGEGP